MPDRERLTIATAPLFGKFGNTILVGPRRRAEVMLYRLFVVDGDLPIVTAGCVGSFLAACSFDVSADVGSSEDADVGLPTDARSIDANPRDAKPGDAEQGGDSGTNVNYDASGDQSNIHVGFPVSFRDDQGRDAEIMGDPLTGTTTAICDDDSFCDYLPNSGAAGGPETMAAAFAGQTPLGTWRLCIGDSDVDGNAEGLLAGWTIDLETTESPRTQSVDNLALPIPDDAYDGTIASMSCHLLTIDEL